MLIKSNREQAGLSQCDLAKRLGVSQQSVAKWETGESLPRALLIPKIANALNCSIDALFGWEVSNTNKED
jgi:transcriptional regulator with XRE-family HTH domain